MGGGGGSIEPDPTKPRSRGTKNRHTGRTRETTTEYHALISYCTYHTSADSNLHRHYTISTLECIPHPSYSTSAQPLSLACKLDESECEVDYDYDEDEEEDPTSKTGGNRSLSSRPYKFSLLMSKP